MLGLTGSVETGKHFARVAADTLKRVHLELGGKAPVVVFDDVSMESGDGDDRWHRLLQRRSGLHRGDARAGRRARSTTTSSRGCPSRPKGSCSATRCRPTRRSGPVNSARQRERVTGFLDRRPDERRDRDRRRARPTGRASSSADGRRGAEAGRRDDPERDLRAGDHGSALQRRGAGDRRGRTRPATASPRRCGPATSGARCACVKALRFGCVWINDHIPLVSEMPHGGFKQSGYGKDLSVYSLEDYTVIKHVMANIS